ncbi:MAG: protein kinase [Muribaculaceae bacterium]|nr:protein kinase [Muribaculaceae bacterium]
MENTDKALRPGTILRGVNAYRIERVLGAGGFGITYLASFAMRSGNLTVRANVAIKEHFIGSHCERGTDATMVVCPGTQDSRTLVANSLKDFIAEARRLADYGKGHDNIVKVNEIFETNGTAYYVMEYLDGQSLADYVAARGPLDEQGIRSLVLPIVDAAAYLHSRRLTHLDIKPGNIMLAVNEDGSLRPVLIDFGLSKHYNEDGSATSTVNTMAFSDGYAPVEQYMGIRTFSPTADVYALGATMLFAATGQNPSRSGDWPGGEPAATFAALPLSQQMRAAMTCAMAMNKGDRYSDAGVLLAALGSTPAPADNATKTLPPQPAATKPLPKPEVPTPAPIYPSPEPPSPVSPMPLAAKPTPNRKPLLIGIIAAVLIIGAILGFVFAGGGNDSDRATYLTPHNLDLAVRASDGQTYYFNTDNWQRLIQPDDEKLGVVIIKDGQRFTLSLDCTEPMNWNEAMSRYSNVMPTKEQAEAMATQNQVINEAIRSFGGLVPNVTNCYWTKTADGSNKAWQLVLASGGYIYNYNKINTARVRAVAPIPTDETVITEAEELVEEVVVDSVVSYAPTAEEIAAARRQEQEAAEARERQRQEAAERDRLRQQRNQSRTPHNLDLAVRGSDNRTYYFNQNDWQNLMQPGDEKLGVVVIGPGPRFIISLNCTEPMTWNEAMRRFGNVMPGASQLGAMAEQHQAINNAIRAFHGVIPSDDSYWSKDADRHHTAITTIYMPSGYITTCANENSTYRVRPVYAIP